MTQVIKNNKWKLVISSLVILLPMLLGVIFWNELPETMNTHWGIDGAPDGQGGRGMMVFGVPLIMLAVHLLCVFITDRDPGNRIQSNKVFALLYWIIPVITVMSTGTIYVASSGKEIDIAALTCALIGVMFVLFGNYMPKYRKNSTLGIKLKWTLASGENWNATHRFAGKVWVIGGMALIACVFLPENAAVITLLAAIIVLVLVPTIYSWLYYRKQLADGFIPEKTAGPFKKWQKISGIIIGVAVLLFCTIITFTGNINITFGDESFTINASYYSDLTVEYDAIESVEYREIFDAGLRTNGFGSPRLSMGTFKNDEFGYYTIYAYNSTEPCVVVHTNTSSLVLRGVDEAATMAIYEQLMQR